MRDADARTRARVLDAIDAALAAHLPAGLPAGLIGVVAFSGGLDSTVLLHALAARTGGARWHAVHVHHGLQPAAEAWPAHCEALARGLGAGFSAARVAIAAEGPQGLEARAREARYQALHAQAATLGVDCLVTAHHADDQAETVLLRLARGAGLTGAGAIAERVRVAGVWRLRPLLAVPRPVLRRYAELEGLRWVEDPSNRHLDHTRNRLRATVLPALAEAIPAAVSNLGRAAELAREAQLVLDEVAQADLAAARREDPVRGGWWARSVGAGLVREAAAATRAGGGCAGGPDAEAGTPAPAHPAPAWLDRGVLAGLSPARQRLCLRAWLTGQGLQAPSLAVTRELQRQLIQARGESGAVRLGTAVARRYRERLWLDVRPLPDAPWRMQRVIWSGEAEIPLEDGCLTIERIDVPNDNVNSVTEFEVSLLPGSMPLRLRPGGPSRSLRHWQQQFGVPRHLRAHLPAIRVAGQLVHVTGVGDHHESGGVQSGLRVRWMPADPLDPRAWVCAMQQLRETRV